MKSSCEEIKTLPSLCNLFPKQGNLYDIMKALPYQVHSACMHARPFQFASLATHVVISLQVRTPGYRKECAFDLARGCQPFLTFYRPSQVHAAIENTRSGQVDNTDQLLAASRTSIVLDLSNCNLYALRNKDTKHTLF